MADTSIVVTPASSGSAVDNSTVVTGAGTVYRQRVSVGDAASNNNASVSSTGALKVDGSAATQPVSATGISNVDVLLSTRTKPADQQHAIVDSGTLTAVTAVTSITNPVAVTGTFWQATQPVSGTVALSGDALASLQIMRRDLNASFLKPRTPFWGRRNPHA